MRQASPSSRNIRPLKIHLHTRPSLSIKSSPQLFDEEFSCCWTSGKSWRPLSSEYQVLFETAGKKERDDSKWRPAGNHSRSIDQSFEPSFHVERTWSVLYFPLFRRVCSGFISSAEQFQKSHLESTNIEGTKSEIDKNNNNNFSR